MIDESTGLPELPEGYFWRVIHPIQDITYGVTRDKSKLVMMLMNQPEDVPTPGLRRKWMQKLLSRKGESSTPPPEVTYRQACKGTSDQAILNAAYTILKRKREDERLASKLGDYPPKKLGG